MRITVLLFLLTVFAVPANAGMFEGLEARADAVRSQTQGDQSYEAQLARKLSDVALNEKGQHDTCAAKEFMKMAEEYAAKAGGAK